MPDLSTLNTFDWAILCLMAWSIGWAAYRGFSNEIFGLLGLIAAFVVTIFTGHLLDNLIASMVPDNALARMFSRAILFLGIMLVINIIAAIGARALRALLSRILDHSLGLLIILLPFLLVNLYIDPKVYPDWLTHARSYPFLEGGAHLLRQVLPQEQIHDDERSNLKSLDTSSEDQAVIKNAADGDDGNSAQNPGKKSNKNQKGPGHMTVKDLFKILKEIFGS